MSELKTEFETALTNKLCLKSTDSNPEEEILLNSFKLFDINNKNTCNQDEFIQTMKYLGISGFKESDLILIAIIFDFSNFSNNLLSIPLFIKITLTFKDSIFS